MLAVENGVYDVLVGSAELMAFVTEYRGVKAVFSGFDNDNPIPNGVTPPYVTISPPLDDVGGPFDTKNARGRQWMFEIGCFASADWNPATVEAMAEIVRGLFHRVSSVAVDGYGVMISSVRGPVVVPSDDTMYGRSVTITLTAAS